MPVPDGRYPLLTGLDAPTRPAPDERRAARGARGRDARGDHRHGVAAPAATSGRAWGRWSSPSPSTRSWSRPATASCGTSATRPTATSSSPAASTGSPPSASTAASAGSCAGWRASTTSWAPATPAPRSATPRASPRPSARAGRDDARVLCVIGDGALTGGMAYEGLNQAGALGSPDHGGAQRQRHEHLRERRGALQAASSAARVDPTLTRVREELETGPLARSRRQSSVGGHIRDATKALWFEPGALFEALGFAYLGPIDGHDISEVRRRALRTHARQGPPGAWST